MMYKSSKKNGVSAFYVLFLFPFSYRWALRGVFIEYSRDIHMYRLCVGYVSVMYRLPIGAYSAQVGYSMSIIFKFNENFLHISQIFYYLYRLFWALLTMNYETI